jgi:folate-binding protein YgfZ
MELQGYRLLTEHVALRITGDDATTWLNGQVTNNVATLAVGDSVYALVVSVKGKIEADAWIARAEEGFWMVIDRAAVEPVTARFEAQIIMEDVTVVATDRAVITVLGPTPELAAVRFRTNRIGLEGHDLLVEPAEVEPTLAALGLKPISAETWERVRIERGRPRFGTDFGIANYPQEAGLKDLAVSFTKGCYVGQEVVCTLENRGKLNRRLMRLRFERAHDESPTLADESGKEVGAVTSWTSTGTEVLALGYLRASAADRVLWHQTPAEILGPAGI